MPKKARKSAVPKAKVIDLSGEAQRKEEQQQKKKAPLKGKFIALKKDDSDDDDDLVAAQVFDKDPTEEVKGLPKFDDDDDEDDLGPADDDFLGGAEEMEEMEEMEEGEEGEDDDDDELAMIGQGSEGDEEDEELDDFEANVERQKRLMQQEAQENAQAAMLENLTRKAKVFESGEEEEPEDEEGDEQMQGVTLQQRKDRIEEVIRVLENFSELREADHTRQEYVDILKGDLVFVYEYSDWLMAKLMDLFPPRELFEFLEVNEKERPMTIRVNTLKTSRRDLAQALTRKGMSVEPTGPWCKVGLQIFESDVAVGSTAEYLGGHYLVQSASSFLPVLCMDVEEGQRVLDMSAAPGGKTTHIAQLLKNTGCLVANDVSAERLVALRANVLRMGITNCVVTNYNGVGFERVMKNFDRVLLDAPCTGVGVISRDPKIKQTKTERDVQLCSQLQKKLILSAIDSLKVGGVLCYSTCSILVEENEATVDYAIRHRYVKIVPTALPFGRPGLTKFRTKRFHKSVEESRRYYPHVFNMDGFFVCKLVKLAHGENTTGVPQETGPKTPAAKAEKAEKKTTKRKAEEPVAGVPAPPAKLLKRRQAETAGEAASAAAEKPAAKGKGKGKAKGKAKSNGEDAQAGGAVKLQVKERVSKEKTEKQKEHERKRRALKKMKKKKQQEAAEAKAKAKGKAAAAKGKAAAAKGKGKAKAS